MSPEQEIIADLSEAMRALVQSSKRTLELVGPAPADAAAFAAMPFEQQLAATAALKQFEQLEGALHGLFRAILRALGVRLKSLYALDIGNHMVGLDIIDDASWWMAIVKPRNDLVHEYPLDAAKRHDRFNQACAALPRLFDAAARAGRVIGERRLLAPAP